MERYLSAAWPPCYILPLIAVGSIMKLLIIALLALSSVPVSAQEITLSGTMHKSNLEGGCWYLQAADKRYELTGDTAVLRELRIDGQHVVVDAVPVKNAASVCMIGEMVRVVRRLDSIRYPYDPPVMTLTLEGTIHRLKSGTWYLKTAPSRGHAYLYEFEKAPPAGSRHIGAHVRGTFRVIVARMKTPPYMDGQILDTTPPARSKRMLQRKYDAR